jgi:glycosyltransferase involved in cell wall biosynthesis
MEKRDNVTYIIAYQYTDERFLELIPESLSEREDVSLYAYKGEGLSANRNFAMDKANADLVVFADDDARFTPESVDIAIKVFEEHPDMDVAFFKASTYTGRSLKEYPTEEREVLSIPEDYAISTLEMVMKRSRVQSVVRFDERFGLGTKFLTCGEEDIWLTDALRMKLKMRYFPKVIVQTSTLLKKSLVYVDAGVQRSKGAYMYYVYHHKAWIHCIRFSIASALKGYCHFWPIFKHMCEGIIYMQRNK